MRQISLQTYGRVTLSNEPLTVIITSSFLMLTSFEPPSLMAHAWARETIKRKKKKKKKKGGGPCWRIKEKRIRKRKRKRRRGGGESE